MLVLTRKERESFRIGKDVSVKVLGIAGSRVKLGVKAPRDVAVAREELDSHERSADGNYSRFQACLAERDSLSAYQLYRNKGFVPTYDELDTLVRLLGDRR